MPPVTARDGAPVIVDFLAVVAVILLAVVAVDPPATAAVVDVESPVTSCDVVLVVSADCSVDAVVELVSAADGFFGPEPPPQAAAIMPIVSTPTRASGPRLPRLDTAPDLYVLAINRPPR